MIRYFTKGYLCETYGAGPGDIDRAAAVAGVEPAMEVNGLPYFDHDGADAIAKALQSRESEWNEVRR
jgi:hypothetical protein